MKVFYSLFARKWRLLALPAIFSLFLSACTEAAPVAAELTSGTLDNCQISAPSSTTSIEAKCSKITVYEDTLSQSGRQIELNVAVRPARGRAPAADPLFFIPGGPGEAATQSFPVVYAAFERINQSRDIVLVDQRGTGASNPLNCEQNTSAGQVEQDFADIETQIQDCLAHLETDPRFYTTLDAVNDLEQVRLALGYEQINLYGGSYGTRVALTYLRLYPEHVRSIIIDGVAPPNWTLGPQTGFNAQQTLDKIFQRCELDVRCHEAFPDLENMFEMLLLQVEENPASIHIINPNSGRPEVVTITRQDLADTIFNMSYSAETASLIPLLIQNTFVSGDFSIVANQERLLRQGVEESISSGMRYSVICAEDVPFFNQETSADGYIGDRFRQTFQEICKRWPSRNLPHDFKSPVVSDKPVLIISGELDPVTPPANGELAASTLSNSTHLIVPGQGHINIYRGCLPRLAADFIDGKDLSEENIQCLEKIKPAPFFLSFSGPGP